MALAVLVADDATFGEDQRSSLLPLRTFPTILSAPPPVEWSSIYPVDSQVKCVSDGLDTCLLISLAPVNVPGPIRAYRSGTDPDRRDFQIALAKRSP